MKFRNVLSFMGLSAVLAAGLFTASPSVEAKNTGVKPMASPTVSAPNTYKLLCPWTTTAAPLKGTDPGVRDVRNVLADMNAGYWQASFSSYFPAGTEIRIKGKFPATRNMSLQVTDSLIGFLTTIGALTDYQIVPEPGSVNPYTSINNVDPTIPAGGDYVAYVHYGKAPANPKPNTIYLDPADYKWAYAIVLVYRLYAPFDDNLANTGNVPLPELTLIKVDGEEIPVSTDDHTHTPAQCIFWTVGEAVVVQGEAALGNIPLSAPLVPTPIPPEPLPPDLQFRLWGGDDVLGQVKIAQWVVNADNAYVYTWLDQTAADLVLVRAQMPTYSTQPGVGSDPQVRYWSLCESSIVFLSTYQCIKDADAVFDQDGYFNVVISVPNKQPANADAAHSFNWMRFGTAEPASPIFRYQSPAPDFLQAPSNWENGNYQNLSELMGQYYPIATYCAKSVFDAHTNAGETPEQVFAACKVGQ